MDEKQVSDFLFEMSERARETTRGLCGRDRFYEGFASGINVAATTVKQRNYEKFGPDDVAKQALMAVALADIFESALSKDDSDD